MLAPQILDWINYVLVEHYAKSVDNYENNYLPVIVDRTGGMDPYQGEIDALLQGMRDRLPDLRLPWLERDITADDIRGLNNLYMSALLPMRNRWPLEKNPAPLAVNALFFCTNASFWGTWTDNAEVNGGLIVGKNMDGENDLRKITVNTLLVVAVEPEPGSGRKKYIGIDWPGFIGTQNGMNEDGLILTPQAAATMPNWDAFDFLDYSLLYRETLEQCTTISDAENYWLNRVHTKISGFNTALSAPYTSGQLSCPSVTFETDSFGGTIREPLDFTPCDPDAILTTNTFFKYSGVYPEAVAITGSYQSELHRTNYRYLAMLELMDRYRKQSKTVGTPEIIEILQAASITEQYQDITEWSFIGYPNKKMFALSKEDLHNKLFNASYGSFSTFTFDEVFQERSRPVIIYLTHCHYDHSLHVGAYRQTLKTTSAWIAAKDEGADYLIEGDRKVTAAELYGMPYPCVQPDIRLMTGQDRKRRAPRYICLSPEVMLTLRTEEVPTDLGKSAMRQVVSMGGGDFFEIYPTPGHSPDSICIRAGEILFIGDLLAAARPMIAGMSGWNRDDLIDTLEKVQWIISTMGVRFCYPGHGGLIPADKVSDILRQMHHSAHRLSAVSEMNEDRLFQITDFAQELIDEAEEVFSATAGRILYVAYQLERLEEDDAAHRCRESMHMDQIDACLMEFRDLCHSFDAGKMFRVEFAFDALRLVTKLKTLFDTRPLSAILPQPLLNRGTRLLLDFIGIAHGHRNPEEFIPTDFNALIEGIAQAWQSNPHLDESIVDLVDDYEKYLASLVLRIGHEPVSAQTKLYVFSPAENLPLATVAAARLFDMVMDLLQWIKRSSPASITIATDIDRGCPLIRITPGNWDVSSLTPRDEKKIRSFTRRFLMCGLNLKTEHNDFRLTLINEAHQGI